MRFFGAPTVLLALGVSAVAGHSYHAFEHGYEPVAGYGVLQKHFLHDTHIDVPNDDFSEVPTYYGGIDDFHQDHGYVSYSEPHDDHNGHELLDDHRYKIIHNYGHHEHHENYVVHDNGEHHAHHDHDHKEQQEHHDNHEICEQHGKHKSYEHHSNHESYEHHGNNDHDNNDSLEQHEDEKHDDGHADDGHGDEHKSVAKYEFKYGVNDPKTGDVKEQWESRTGDKVKGGYALKEADGTTRVVHYSADKKKGFEATVKKIGHPSVKHIVEQSHHGHLSDHNGFYF